MSSYGAIYVGELELDHSRNNLHSFYLRLFQDGEKKVVTSSAGTIPAILRARYEGHVAPTPGDPFVYLETSIANLKDRLDVLGYAMQTAERYYEQASGPEMSLGIIEPMALITWMAGIAELNRLIRDGASPDGDATAKLLWQNKGFGFAFPGDNILVALRLMCEAIGDGYFRYDITDLVQGGWVDASHALVARSMQENADEYSFQAPMIVLTEGTSDCRALRGAIEVLYPHLGDFFSFMDFRTHKAAGSAGELVKLIKAFAAAGVANRTIAIFDNDAAAQDARRALRGVSLPDRIAVLALPDIELLRCYPTVGPEPTAGTDVNGRAGSIELYFGRDVLTRSDGSLRPVRWGQFLGKVNAYQGVVEDKEELAELFALKVARAKLVPPTPDDPNWAEMRSIFKMIFRVFRELDGRHILAGRR